MKNEADLCQRADEASPERSGEPPPLKGPSAADTSLQRNVFSLGALPAIAASRNEKSGGRHFSQQPKTHKHTLTKSKLSV